MKQRTGRGFIAYIRISDERRQGQGASLDAQRGIIAGFAKRQNLTIVRWVEERESASKTGRAKFQDMLKLLRREHAEGLIFHKVDRSARNIEDWKELRVLGELGFHVYFASEGVDLRKVEDVLMADIFAAMASHYSRNLRQEVLKGMRGRLNQGIYPFRAPLGYLDMGGGAPKALDPTRAPLILEAFRLYDSGRHSLFSLQEEIARQGLRTHAGKAISVKRLNEALRNPFYMGLIKIKRWHEVFNGAHEPIVPAALFERVQERLDGRCRVRKLRHSFLFRRMLKCATCGYSLIGETAKGFVYYRCHTRTCPKNTVREDVVEARLHRKLEALRWQREAFSRLRERAKRFDARTREREINARRANQLLMAKVTDKLDRLLDAHLDGRVGAETFASKQERLERERAVLREKDQQLASGQSTTNVAEFLELVQAAWPLYKEAKGPDKRRMVEILTSNWVVTAGNPLFMLAPPFSAVEICPDLAKCGPNRHTPRTPEHIVSDMTMALDTLPIVTRYQELVEWYRVAKRTLMA